MTENKTDEQISVEENKKHISCKEMFEGSLNGSATDAAASPVFQIEYAPHKTQGLQSASDMWIDKGRLFDGLSKDVKDLDAIKKLSRR